MNASIEDINKAIAAALAEEVAVIDVQAYGLAESVAVRGENVTLPAIVLPSGECLVVYAETDKHDVVLYHRLNEIAYQEDATAFGNARAYKQVADMSLIVFGNRETISQYAVEGIACKAIASANTRTIVRSDFNALQVFASEYAGETYFMGSAYYLFKINYRITSTYNPRCA